MYLNSFDLIIIGAGAAGLFCASVAGQRGAKVALIDHSEKLAEKIRISGGGRCNFTNIDAGRPERFVSAQPRFARETLRRYPPRRFIDLVRQHGIAFHEKHRGQLFCDRSSEQIIEMLRVECDRGRISWFRPVTVNGVRRRAATLDYELDSSAGVLSAPALVIATGGLSIPKIGATDFAYRMARQFGVKLIEPSPGLVPLTFDEQAWLPMSTLAGLSVEVDIRVKDKPQATPFREDMLFTHRGLSGPAILQISNFWRTGDSLLVDLAGGRDLEQLLLRTKQTSKQNLAPAIINALSAQTAVPAPAQAPGPARSQATGPVPAQTQSTSPPATQSIMPKRLIGAWLDASPFAADAQRKIAEVPNKQLIALAQAIRQWPVTPTGTEGYRKAEVTLGGVDTSELDAASLQVQKQPGLYFIGEAVDVTGWLGGYNFQWAWASGYGAAMAITEQFAEQFKAV